MNFKAKISLFSFLACLITVGSVFATFTLDPSNELDIDDVNPDVDFNEIQPYDLKTVGNQYEYETRAVPKIMRCYEHHQFITPLEIDKVHLDTFTMMSKDNRVELDPSLISVFLANAETSAPKKLTSGTDYIVANNVVKITGTIYELVDIKDYTSLIVEYMHCDPTKFVAFDYVSFIFKTINRSKI